MIAGLSRLRTVAAFNALVRLNPFALTRTSVLYASAFVLKGNALRALEFAFAAPVGTTASWAWLAGFEALSPWCLFFALSCPLACEPWLEFEDPWRFCLCAFTRPLPNVAL